MRANRAADVWAASRAAVSPPFLRALFASGCVTLSACRLLPHLPDKDPPSTDAIDTTQVDTDDSDRAPSDSDVGEDACGALVPVPAISWLHVGESCWRASDRDPILLCAKYWDGYPLAESGDTAAICAFQSLYLPTTDGRCIRLPSLCADARWESDPLITRCEVHPECCAESMLNLLECR